MIPRTISKLFILLHTVFVGVLCGAIAAITYINLEPVAMLLGSFFGGLAGLFLGLIVCVAEADRIHAWIWFFGFIQVLLTIALRKIHNDVLHFLIISAIIQILLYFSVLLFQVLRKKRQSNNMPSKA